jgi:hypothetical protein
MLQAAGRTALNEAVTISDFEVPDAITPDQIPVEYAEVTGINASRGEQIQLTEPPPPPPEPLRIPPNYYNWLTLAQCESGGDWSINTGNGYYGGLQFALSSWKAAGGLQYAQYPHQASMLEQMWTAETLLIMRVNWNMDPWAAWPVCSRRAGL